MTREDAEVVQVVVDLPASALQRPAAAEAAAAARLGSDARQQANFIAHTAAPFTSQLRDRHL